MAVLIPKYQEVARQLEDKLRLGLLVAGDKLPSVRILSEELKVSINTVQQAYYSLEADGLVEARPGSGYYARPPVQRLPDVSRSTQLPVTAPLANSPDRELLLATIVRQQNLPGWLPFSMSVPAPDLLPVAKLTKALQQAQREMPNAGTSYDDMQGNAALRRQIARYALFWGGQLTDDELVTTEGCTPALALCLKALTRPGDTVAVESPAYFGILNIALSLGLNVLELPICNEAGVDLDALDEHLRAKRVQVCLFVPNFSNPGGSCMPDAQKQRLVQMLETYQIPLIEDDLYGDLHFASHRPKPCKAYDRSGLVLWCGSVSKTLAPGYRVGWVAPGRYLNKVIQLKRYQAGISPGLTQQAVANFLANDRYELHLRRLRQTLQTNCQHYQRAIRTYFPESTRISTPQGGFALWVELEPDVNTLHLCEDLLPHKISIMPGNIFTLQPKYMHCMRLSYGLPYTEQVEAGLKQIGRSITARQPQF